MRILTYTVTPEEDGRMGLEQAVIPILRDIKIPFVSHGFELLKIIKF